MARANQEQADHWNSDEAAHWLEFEDRYERTLHPFIEPIRRGASLVASDRVLDVGCGTGATTRAAARAAPAGEAAGVDISAPMLERARQRASSEGLTNVRFEVGDAQDHHFEPAAFDVAMSRFGVMFFADPEAAFANIGRAVRPGGRLSFVCWQGLVSNEWMLVPGAAVASVTALPAGAEPGSPGPFAFADKDRVAGIVAGAGFAGVNIDAVNETMRLGDSVADTMDFFTQTGMGKAVLARKDDETRERIVDAVSAALQPYATADGVRLACAAWLVTALRN